MIGKGLFAVALRRFHVLSENTKNTSVVSHRGLLERVLVNFSDGPKPGSRGIMQHRPFFKHPIRTIAKIPKLHLRMPVVLPDPVEGVADPLARTFKHLNKDIVPTHKRACDIIARVAPPGV